MPRQGSMSTRCLRGSSSHGVVVRMAPSASSTETWASGTTRPKRGAAVISSTSSSVDNLLYQQIADCRCRLRLTAPSLSVPGSLPRHVPPRDEQLLRGSSHWVYENVDIETAERIGVTLDQDIVSIPDTIKATK